MSPRLQRWTTRALLGVYAALLTRVFLATLGQGLWEDGYFAKRFARNFWRHGSFAWNVEDGPIYGMTSQTLELVAALVYRVTREHWVLALKLVLLAALPVTLAVMGRCAALDARGDVRGGRVASKRAAGAGLIALLGLACPLVPEIALSGLETPLALLTIALSLWAYALFERGGAAWPLVVAILATYLTRPDAILIPCTLLAGLWWTRRGRSVTHGRHPDVARIVRVLGAVGLGLGVLLLSFRLGYGTALPLPFYVKVQGLSAQTADHLAIFGPEKPQNAELVAFFAAPFVFVAAHTRRRDVRLLVVSALVFGAYHYVATIETMGQLARFYLPGLVPLVLAAALGYRDYQDLRRLALVVPLLVAYVALYALWHPTGGVRPAIVAYPFILALALALLAPARRIEAAALSVAAILFAGAWLIYPVDAIQFDDDETILLRQIRPRMAFRELERVRSTLNPRVLFHTDMGAPGVLFPDARVVDIDGLLNPDILLRHTSVEQLCRREHPDVFYVPNHTYPALRAELLGGECIKAYTRVVPDDGYTALHVRTDELPRYLAAGPL